MDTTDPIPTQIQSQSPDLNTLDSLPIGLDGKPIPTPEMVTEFLAICEEPFVELWQAMVDKASARAYKGGWRGRITIDEAWERLFDELKELKYELTSVRFRPLEEGPLGIKPDLDYQKILYEAADVANFLVVLVDLVKECVDKENLLSNTKD
jgi:hypothetical protein